MRGLYLRQDTCQASIPPAGPAVSYAYDIFDQLTNAYRGADTTTITYDKAGRKISLSDPDMGLWTYSYDVLGNLETQTDARGCITTLGYDELSRLKSKTYTGPGACDTTTDVSYTYDQGGASAKALGRRTSMSDGSGSTSWNYDALGHVITETKTVGTEIFKSAWGYNSAELVELDEIPERTTAASVAERGELQLPPADGCSTRVCQFQYLREDPPATTLPEGWMCASWD